MEKKRNNRWIGLAVSILISLIAFYLAFRKADLESMGAAFREARYGPIIIGFLLVNLLTLVRGLRWSILTGGRLSVMDGFWLFNIGFLFNNILPARLGEFARAYLAGRREKMHFTSAVTSITVERLMDMISVAVMFAVILLVFDLPAWATGAGTLMGASAIVGMMILAFAASKPGGALKLGTKIMSWIPGIDEQRADAFLKPFIDGLGGVSSWKIFLLSQGLSLLAWFCSGLVGWIMMFGFWESPPFIDGIMAIAGAGIGISVPAAPSGFGTYEAAIIGVLTAIGYDGDISRSYALILHLSNILITTLVGMIGLMREGLTFKEIIESSRLHEEADISEI